MHPHCLEQDAPATLSTLDIRQLTAILYSMKTTLNIPDDRISTLLELTNAKTKTEAINKAIEEYIRREKIKALLALEGSGGFMTREELLEMRKKELHEFEPDHASE